MTTDQLKKFARAGAKIQIRQLVQMFPGIDQELRREAMAARAAHARAVKQQRQKPSR